ncbi:MULTISPECIES: class I SAM-dependent methyltransferase [unclassified Agarivorans]|uniref:class I SAM-dependent methyltransferase n=1 Tax=unclassified Agarivorans TaxID=2636026 RepID=UPI0026E25EB7|nr:MULTISPECIES: class I SAM-dependent methyltransferase [unclassified Agarivorans]MDO6687152.1 class I SAM-dependent methyltransferase [Agarivorans sp. 3_MG-2023]MDO6716921.1 class I SAM-dependent methyltransferase [Agarivorans sp. 2_MG-2023]
MKLDLPPLEQQALRVIHGRGHCIEGAESFNIEWLPPVMLIVAYAPLSANLTQQLLEQLKAELLVEGVFLQQRDQPMAPVKHLWGSEQTPATVNEHGLAYKVEVGTHQNFGLFLDMAKGREWVKQHSEDKNVLNLFSYTCGFAVAAIAGGANAVVNIDMSKAALSVGRDNLRLNQLDDKKARFFGHDLFKSWGKLRKHGPYDLVIADPPSMQKGSFLVEKDYPRIIRQLPSLLSENGIAMLCLNAPWLSCQFLLDAVASEAPELRLIETLDRPETVLEQSPDDGLKVLIFENSPA